MYFTSLLCHPTMSSLLTRISRMAAMTKYIPAICRVDGIIIYICCFIISASFWAKIDTIQLFGRIYPFGLLSLKKEGTTCPESEPDEHAEQDGGAAEAGARQRRQRRAHAVPRRVTPNAAARGMVCNWIIKYDL